ncbi:MAG TPA: aminoacyl-tRNA hydrolase [Clostridiales bacterium]|nr:aminoacyl-tRNA hydrolase [Clostridiales bacterium]
MYLIVGLGNPGKEYAGTRHNVGFDAIDFLAYKNDVKLNKLKFNAVFGEYNVNGEKVLLFKPVTYMNLSGNAVIEAVRFYKIPIENIIVIYDDIDIGLGSLRIRPHGSSGTHNGMKSLIYQLQSDKFKRIRIGIGKSKNPNLSLADYVLQKFDSDERTTVNETIQNAGLAAEDIIRSGLNRAMENYNKNIKE